MCLLAAARADDLDASLTDLETAGDARLFFVNFTSSLIQVNATILAYGLIAIAIAGAAAIALYYLFLESQNSSSSSYGSYGNQYSQYNYARSADDMPYQMNFKILEWISLMKDLYENFDYNDLDCQKRLICEVMKEPEFYGNVAKKFKAGFEYASFLDYVSIPDDMRELLDEYMDANARADQQKECAEYFPCNFSVKDQFAKTFGGNHL